MRWLAALLIFVASLAVASPASAGRSNSLVLTPSQPVAGSPVSFSWSGGGDDVTLYVNCADGTSAIGVILEDGDPESFAVTFPTPTSCSAQADIVTYTAPGKYQRKQAYSSFIVQ